MPADQSPQNAVLSRDIIGKVPHFNHAINNFQVFKVQLQQFFVANGVLEEVKKKALLLTALDESSYILLQNLLNPLLPESDAVTLKKCIEVFEGHLKPPSSVFMERYKFYSAEKQTLESVQEWEARVRALAINCEFGSLLETALRNKFVMGLEKGPAREKIFLEGLKVDIKRAVEIATTAEYIQQQSKAESNTENILYTNKMGMRKKGQQQQKQQHNQPTNNNLQAKTQMKNGQQQQQQCAVCGYSNHASSRCKYRNYKCNNCHKRGHLRKMCRNDTIHHINSNVDTLNLFAFQTNSDGPIVVEVKIEEKLCTTELDTGSQHCIMPLNFLKLEIKEFEITAVNLMLRTYTGAVKKPEGMAKLKVEFNGKSKLLSFIVVKEQGPILLGRDFLNCFNVSLANMDFNEVVNEQSVGNKCLERFPKLFEGKLGCFNKGEAHLVLKENAQPKFFKPRPVPLAIKEKVEKEISKLVELQVLEPVEFSEWATPIVPILKKNGEVRICGDYKVTVNPNIEIEQFPLPKIEDIFAQLYDGKEFTKLDLSMAYQQIKVDEESSKLTTISTSKGLFKYKRLIYGLATAPAIFQRIMETLLLGLEGVAVFLDDILITAPNRQLHEKRVEKVLETTASWI